MTPDAYVTVYTLLITTMAAVITGAVVNVLGYLKARDASNLGQSNRAGIAGVADAINGRISEWKRELLAATAASIDAAYARGVEAERTRAAGASGIEANTLAMVANTAAVQAHTVAVEPPK